jgi:hypothetical protein
MPKIIGHATRASVRAGLTIMCAGKPDSLAPKSPGSKLNMFSKLAHKNASDIAAVQKMGDLFGTT